jgi:small conductance mechanosensitive channel
MWERLFTGPFDWRDATLAAAMAVAAALGVAALAARVVRAVLITILGDSLDEASVTPAIRRPVRIVWVAVFLLTCAALIFPALEVVGIRARAGLPLRTLTDWFFRSGLRVVLVAIFAYASVRMAVVLVRRFEHEISRGAGVDVLERAKRARTLGGLIENVVTAVVVSVALLMILRELRLDILPLLTGAGILGVALGFGAQTLVRDVISGFFLILEDQMRVGDAVVINGVGGLVEAIHLRTVVLRDGEGTVHIFPAGGITTLANRSREYGYAVLDVSVGYTQDLEKVTEALKDAGAEVQRDPAYQSWVLAPIEVLGVESFTETQVTVKLRMKTAPQRHADVARELRRRIKRIFDERAIGGPSRQQEIVIRRGK